MFERGVGALHHWDLPAGTWIYRVFLLPDGLEVDVAVAPRRNSAPCDPHFLPLFGATQPLAPPARSDPQDLSGWAWHHILHAQASIERRQLWWAEYWIQRNAPSRTHADLPAPGAVHRWVSKW